MPARGRRRLRAAVHRRTHRPRRHRRGGAGLRHAGHAHRPHHPGAGPARGGCVGPCGAGAAARLRSLRLSIAQQRRGDLAHAALIQPRRIHPHETPGRRDRHIGLGQRAFGGAIEQQHHALQVRCRREHTELVAAAPVLLAKAAQVHQHHIGLPHQRGQRLLPGAVEAVALVDAVAPVGVGREIEVAQALVHLRRAGHEAIGQAAVEKGEQVVRVQRAAEQVGAGDQHRVAREAPALDHAVEQGLHARVLLEHAQHQQRGRHALRRQPAAQRPARQRYPQPGNELGQRDQPSALQRGQRGRGQHHEPVGREQVPEVGEALGAVGPRERAGNDPGW
eukprot:Opistho-1_new@7596